MNKIAHQKGYFLFFNIFISNFQDSRRIATGPYLSARIFELGL